MNDIGVYGLGVMGSAIAKNLLRHGYKTSVFYVEKEATENFISKNRLALGCFTVKDFVYSLNKPRAILLMITAGDPVDEVIDQLMPFLNPGDIVIDCGNSFYLDTERRQEKLEPLGIKFIGCGVSGGEYGAEFGPCLMPSGDYQAYKQIDSILTSIAAKTDEGMTCCKYIGPGGSGHFVKMVHNSIEYAEMQLIADVYDIYHSSGLSDNEIIEQFSKINQGVLRSYLWDITIGILKKSVQEDNLIHKISDVARQKGTGRWVAELSLEKNIPIPSLLAAVETRFLSEMIDERHKLSDLFPNDRERQYPNNINISKSVLAARLSINSQGFDLITKVSEEKGYAINLSDLAMIWENGCIIKSDLLKTICKAYKGYNGYFLTLPEIENLLKPSINDLQGLTQLSIVNGLYTPIINSSYSYLCGITTSRLSTYLIQAQRDFFGAHTYERTDRPGSFHTDWRN